MKVMVYFYAIKQGTPILFFQCMLAREGKPGNFMGPVSSGVESNMACVQMRWSPSYCWPSRDC